MILAFFMCLPALQEKQISFTGSTTCGAAFLRLKTGYGTHRRIGSEVLETAGIHPLWERFLERLGSREYESLNVPHFLGNRRSAADACFLVALLCAVTEICLFKDLSVKLMTGSYRCPMKVLPLVLIEHISYGAFQRHSESQAQNKQSCLPVKY